MSLPNPVLCSVSKLQSKCKPYSIASKSLDYRLIIKKEIVSNNNLKGGSAMGYDLIPAKFIKSM